MKNKKSDLTINEDFLNSIQKSLSPDQVILEYFLGEEFVFIYTITNKEVFVLRKPSSVEMTENISELRKDLQNPRSDLKDVFRNSELLYDRLVAKALSPLNGQVNQLIIVRDQVLNYIPFEVLGTPLKNGFNYLLNDYQISYAFSCSSRLLPEKQKIAENNLIGFSPSFNNLIEDPDTTESRLLAYLVRSGYAELQGAEAEVLTVSKDVNGDSFIGVEASENVFKSQAGNYKVILLSTHGIINEDDPRMSELLFAKPEIKNQEDNILHLHEVEGLDLNAELVVLSACNTGVGKLHSGEGVFSFARSFTLAGAKSLLMTSWKVDDNSTSELIIEFFKNIIEGQTKDEALRNSKLSFLDNSQKHNSYQHPFFWASLQLIGNPESISFSKNYKLAYALIPLMLMVLVVFSKRW